MKRKCVSKKIRFEVFKRDVFQCQYCGSQPPSVVLELDHLHPVSKGGDNSIDNLITACFDCNRGKSDGLLSVAVEGVIDRLAIVKEKEDQLKEYNKLLRGIRKRQDDEIDEVELVFQETYPDMGFTASYRQSIRNFLKELPIVNLLDYMEKACLTTPNSDRATKYFCGICWKVIRDNQE